MARCLFERIHEWLPLTRSGKPEKLYEYVALEPDEIRTLLIQPGTTGSPLTGRIEQHKLGDPNKPYEALSYVWGRPKRDKVINIGAQEVRVTQNAKTLLCQLRDEHQPRRVWIDGICIDQDNLKERSHQVTLMQAIFSGASSVLIWVGEADEDTPSVFSFFTLMDERRRAQAEDKITHEQREQPDLDSSVSDAIYIRTRMKDPSKVRKFANRPWFHRSWTFQEACLSKESYLVCGNFQLHWRVFISATLYLTATGMLSIFGQSADTIAALANMAAANPDHLTPYLSLMLPLTRKLKATNQHDKIFSVLGMADRTNMPSLDLSYDLSVSEVYARTTKAMITQEQGLSVLSGVNGPNRQDPRLPSWVPDWNLSRPAAYLHGYDFPNITQVYNINEGASFSNDIPSDLGPQTHILKLRGARMDRITRICDPKALLLESALLKGITRKITARSVNREMDLWIDKIDKIAENLGHCSLTDYRQTQEGFIQALIRTLTADRGGVGGEGKARWFTDSKMSGCSCEVPNGSWWDWSNPMKENALDLDVTKEMNMLNIALWTFLTGRKVFMTNRRLIGIAAGGVKVGDEVWDIVGGQVPFVLRSKNARFWENSGQKKTKGLQVVGEAYVHGVMKGELWKDRKETKEEDHYYKVEALRGAELEFEDLELV